MFALIDYMHRVDSILLELKRVMQSHHVPCCSIPLTGKDDPVVFQIAYLSDVCKGLIEPCRDRKLLEIDIVNILWQEKT